ncbi:hypothetical protein E3T61_03105 [Cryobacterium lactosi]|uniref:Uncharacterized protein n=1 Tax=Cryobacterium lactosi TaxID=1259202 RepID=A0A4R9BY13_9MICO|nr:hypothetical protein [Cryobacterium lactosi]TFD94001.1 hypothetical protein E3T61_03105 [Cryobacterium lactosi]
MRALLSVSWALSQLVPFVYGTPYWPRATVSARHAVENTQHHRHARSAHDLRTTITSAPVTAGTVGVLIRDAIVNDTFYDIGTTFDVITDPIIDSMDGVVYHRVAVADDDDSWFLAEDVRLFDAETAAASLPRTYRVLATTTVTIEQDVVAGSAADAQEAVRLMGLDLLNGLNTGEVKLSVLGATSIDIDS